ncbi:MAG TPA: DMT family transporter [Pyrinomonadaceae bacterium]|jgi:drug/metabolite transporter (DMT)-like permease|nr:DMT family transporter [Pyrinomonadaceae bacterium]
MKKLPHTPQTHGQTTDARADGRRANRPTVADEQTKRAYAFMLASSLSFAVMGALSHAAGERCDWQLVAFARSSLAFLLTLTLSLSAGVRLVLFRPALLWMRSIAGSFGVLFAFYALTHLPISTSITLTNTVPVWVTLLAWPVLGQRPRAGMWAAIAVGLAGVLLIQRPEATTDRLAGALALGNAVSTSVSMIGLNRLGGVDARAVVTHFSGVATVFTLAFMLLSGGRVDYNALRDTTTLALLLGVGVAATLGQLTMTKAFASTGSPSRVSVVGLMQIVFALLFDLLLWHRHFDALVLLGIALVVGPSAWLMLRNPLRRQAAIHTTGVT